MAKTTRPRGRPRLLNRERGIEIAERLFWTHGYESTSIADLTAAMGITPPSLYAAFGSKENLFKEAVEFYVATELAPRARAFEEADTGLAAVRTYLLEIARFYCDPSSPKGCMVSASLMHYAEQNSAMAELLTASRQLFLDKLCNRLEQSVKEGELTDHTDVEALARFIASIVQGMSVQASDGATAKELTKVVDIALAAWPDKKPQTRRH